MLKRLLVGAVLLALPAAAGLAVFTSSRGNDAGIDALDRRAAPVVVAAEQRVVAGQQPVSAELTPVAGRELLAPGWSGVVTAAFVVPGTRLATGSGVVSVDGVVRVALATPQPFFRPLEAGDRGADVAALNRALVALAYLPALPATEDSYPAATTAAVKRWATDLGVREADGRFNPAWVVWLPFEPFEVGETKLVAGAPAPPAGSAIAKEPQRLSRARLLPAAQGEALQLETGVEYVFIAGTERFTVDAARGEVAAPELPRLAALLKPGQTGQADQRLNGTLQRATPLRVVAVPSTAVQAGAAGGLCVWIPEGTGYVARSVTVAGSRSGVTNVRAGLVAGERVLANPVDVLEKPQCPSK